jgi:hypothetical protein
VDARPWLNELRAELARRKLPPLYVERFVLELSDHFSDCMEDRMSTDAKDLHGVFQRLGSPGQVASSAAQEYRRAKFSRRHPVLMFVLLPVLSLPVLWCTSIMAVMLMVKMLGIETGNSTTATAWRVADAAMPFLVVGLMVVPVAVAAAFFCRIAARAGVSWRWSLAACCLIAVLGSAAMTQFVLPTETTKGMLTFGFRLALKPTASQALQFLAPMAICGWAMWRQVRRTGSHSQPA